jgi:hypothetical protein
MIRAAAPIFPEFLCRCLTVAALLRSRAQASGKESGDSGGSSPTRTKLGCRPPGSSLRAAMEECPVFRFGVGWHFPERDIWPVGPLSEMPVYHAQSRRQPSLASVGRRLATRAGVIGRQLPYSRPGATQPNRFENAWDTCGTLPDSQPTYTIDSSNSWSVNRR